MRPLRGYAAGAAFSAAGSMSAFQTCETPPNAVRPVSKNCLKPCSTVSRVYNVKFGSVDSDSSSSYDEYVRKRDRCVSFVSCFKERSDI